jgi:hypothetical protein
MSIFEEWSPASRRERLPQTHSTGKFYEGDTRPSIQRDVGLARKNGYTVPIKGERILTRADKIRLRRRGKLSELQMSQDAEPTSMLGFLDTLLSPKSFVSAAERERVPGLNIFGADTISPDESRERHGFSDAPPAVLGGMGHPDVPRKRNLIDESYSNLLD